MAITDVSQLPQEIQNTVQANGLGPAGGLATLGVGALTGAPQADNAQPEQPSTPTPIPQAAPTPQSNTGASALSGTPSPQQGTFAQKIAQAADKIGIPSGPGGWAKSLVASAQHALAGGMDALASFPSSEQTGGHGPLEGIGDAVRNLQAQKIAKQRAADEHMAALTDDQVKRVNISHENMQMAYQQRLIRSLDREDAEKDVESGKLAMSAFTSGPAPAQIIAEGLTSDQAQQMIKDKKLDPTQQHAYPTGLQEVKDAQGNDSWRPTYSIIDNPPTVTLDKDHAKWLNDNVKSQNGVPFQEGQNLPGYVAGKVFQQAANAETSNAAIDHMRVNLGLETQDDKEKIATRTLTQDPAFMTALAQSDLDDIEAPLKTLTKNTDFMKAHPNFVQEYEGMFGGPVPFLKAVQEYHKVQEKTIHDNAAQAGSNEPLLTAVDKDTQSLSPEGQEIMKKYTPGVRNIAYQLLNYDIDPKLAKIRAAGNQATFQQYADAAEQLAELHGSKWSLADAEQQYKEFEDPKIQGTLKNMNAITENGGLLDVALNNFNKVDPTKLQAINKAENWWNVQGGDPDVVALKNSIVGLRNRYALALSGGFAPQSDQIKDADSIINAAFSTNQAQAAAGVMTQELAALQKSTAYGNPYIQRRYADQLAQGQQVMNKYAGKAPVDINKTYSLAPNADPRTALPKAPPGYQIGKSKQPDANGNFIYRYIPIPGAKQ